MNELVTLGQLGIAPMSQPEAAEIADWQFEPPYDFYDLSADADDLALLLDPERRRDRFFSARAGEELVGFFEFWQERGALVVGLGLRPDLTGHGLGGSFVADGLAYARERFAPRVFRLSVASFNERAIAVYERSGFVVTRSFVHETNGGSFPFLEMERPA